MVLLEDESLRNYTVANINQYKTRKNFFSKLYKIECEKSYLNLDVENVRDN